MDAGSLIHYIGLALQPGFLMSAALFAVLTISIVRVINDKNELEWWHFIATKGADGVHYADIDKLGKVVGIVIGSWAIVSVTTQGHLDFTLLGVYLGYVGGVAGFAAYLRAKGGLPPATDVPK